jgi:hypothetical protein
MLPLQTSRWVLKPAAAVISRYWKRSFGSTRRLVELPGLQPLAAGLVGSAQVLAVGAAACGSRGFRTS